MQIKSLICLALSLLISGCGISATYQSKGDYSAQNDKQYNYAILSPLSHPLAKQEMRGFLLERGYTVIPANLYKAVLENFIIHDALVFQCNAAGTAERAVIGISQKVSCSAVDYETGKPVYNGFGEHMGDFEEDDFIGATAAALNNIFPTGQVGRILTIQELATNFAQKETSPSASGSEKENESSESTGTGFFVNNKGYVATNHHVIDGCKQINIKNSLGATSSAEVIIFSEEDDLAVIKTKIKSNKFASVSAPPLQGEYVATYGFPLPGLLSTDGIYTDGRINALRGMGSNKNFLQVSVPVQHGNSGGALVNKYGELVGVIASKLNAVAVAGMTGDIPQNVNFAVKESRLTRLLDRVDVPYNSHETKNTKYLPEDLNNKIKAYSVLIHCKS
ncbi:serine protease [Kiloniella sp. EL199]|uniref:S1 family peptidase n=1 Tax=Kiloniella sp. EL199 TaxID=2107581 RepID=UPI000EA3C9C2|nr:serine protease [Kiloniella sp. EL199]